MNINELFSMPSPDVFVVPHDLWRAARGRGRYPHGAPLLAVEVLSPSNRRVHVEAKTGIYLEAESLAVWNVNLQDRTVTVHTKGEPTLILGSHDKVHLPPLLLSVELDTSDFFRLT